MHSDTRTDGLKSPSNPVTRGDQALARGAVAAAVSVVTGYPGSPSTGVMDALIDSLGPEKHVQWAPNEKVAVELAFGASLAGARSLVVLKSVGMNIALDPLATISLSGCQAGMVILLGDDPGAWSSQNEQDSRWLARTSELPIIAPTSVAQAGSLMVQAFAWSESIGTPVIVHITRALALAEEEVADPWELPESKKRFLRRRNRWVVLPYLVNGRHRAQHRRLRRMQHMLDASPYDLATGRGPLGVVAVGYAHTKLAVTIGRRPHGFRVLGLSSLWPLPERSLLDWLHHVERMLVIEEGGPFVEEGLRALIQRHRLPVRVLGRFTRAIPMEGELSESDLDRALGLLSSEYEPTPREDTQRPMPSTVPLCDDCGYLPTLESLLRAMEQNGGRRRYVVVGETGCMVRANLPPWEFFDVKYSLGSGLGIGMGLALREPRRRVVALLGDSSFFHSDINAMPYAAQLNPTMLVVILDNDTTALTGGQAHPGSSLDERGRLRERVDIAEIVRACGVEPHDLRATDPESLDAAFTTALSAEGLTVVVVRAPCPKYLAGG